MKYGIVPQGSEFKVFAIDRFGRPVGSAVGVHRLRDDAESQKDALNLKGGKGSGNHGHKGRPGERGGSGEGDGDITSTNQRSPGSGRTRGTDSPLSGSITKEEKARLRKKNKEIGASHIKKRGAEIPGSSKKIGDPISSKRYGKSGTITTYNPSTGTGTGHTSEGGWFLFEESDLSEPPSTSSKPTRYFIGGDRGDSDPSENILPVMSAVRGGDTVIFPTGVEDPGSIQAHVFPKGTSNRQIFQSLASRGYSSQEIGGMFRRSKSDGQDFLDYFDQFGFDKDEGSIPSWQKGALNLKGGQGSGNHGHKGRKGERGGSSSDGSGGGTTPSGMRMSTYRQKLDAQAAKENAQRASEEPLPDRFKDVTPPKSKPTIIKDTGQDYSEIDSPSGKGKLKEVTDKFPELSKQGDAILMDDDGNLYIAESGRGEIALRPTKAPKAPGYQDTASDFSRGGAESARQKASGNTSGWKASGEAGKDYSQSWAALPKPSGPMTKNEKVLVRNPDGTFFQGYFLGGTPRDGYQSRLFTGEVITVHPSQIYRAGQTSTSTSGHGDQAMILGKKWKNSTKSLLHDDEEMISFGSDVKALGDGRIGGHLILFGNPEEKDFYGDWFTSETYVGPNHADGRDVTINHRLEIKTGIPEVDEVMKSFTSKIFKPGGLKTHVDEIGIFGEVMCDLSDAYDRKVYELAEQGKLKWSSGAARHMIDRGPDGQLKMFVIAEGALTPMPAEPRMVLSRVMPLKSLTEMWSK